MSVAFIHEPHTWPSRFSSELLYNKVHTLFSGLWQRYAFICVHLGLSGFQTLTDRERNCSKDVDRTLVRFLGAVEFIAY